MVNWRSFSVDNSDLVARFFTYTGGQYIHNALQQPSIWFITSLRRPKIIDALLTLIFRIVQGVCHFLFSLWRQHIPHLWMSASNRHSDYPRCRTQHHWRSIDSHLQDLEWSICLLVWDIKAAKASKKDNDIPKSIWCKYQWDIWVRP